MLDCANLTGCIEDDLFPFGREIFVTNKVEEIARRHQLLWREKGGVLVQDTLKTPSSKQGRRVRIPENVINPSCLSYSVEAVAELSAHPKTRQLVVSTAKANALRCPEECCAACSPNRPFHRFGKRIRGEFMLPIFRVETFFNLTDEGFAAVAAPILATFHKHFLIDHDLRNPPLRPRRGSTTSGGLRSGLESPTGL